MWGYSSESLISTILIRCLCNPRLRSAFPWTGTEMRASTPAFV